jgi:hypothetical protein
MKCLKMGCDKEVQDGWECCSRLHGADVRLYRSQIQEAFSANAQKGFGSVRDLYTIEEILTYIN